MFMCFLKFSGVVGLCPCSKLGDVVVSQNEGTPI